MANFWRLLLHIAAYNLLNSRRDVTVRLSFQLPTSQVRNSLGSRYQADGDISSRDSADTWLERTIHLLATWCFGAASRD